jgi:hypothetical protein
LGSSYRKLRRPWLEHVLAGVQYALGDLEADATPRLRTE